MKLFICILLWMMSLAPGRRHEEQAMALAEVIAEEPPLFADDDDRMKTASLVVSIAFSESSFRNDAVGDQGRALCMFQLWHAPRAVLTDLKLCTRLAFERLRYSLRKCGMGNVLGIYAGGPGGCVRKKTQRISNHRLWLANRLARQVP